MEFQANRIAVPRSARVYSSERLETAAEAKSVWFAIHGYGQLAGDFLESLGAVLQPGRLIIAPEALSRFYLENPPRVGASWMTREDRLSEIGDQVRYLDILYDQVMAFVDPASCPIGVLGFSQGVATAARWVSRGQVSPRRLVLWGESAPPELDDPESLAKLGATELFLVSGSRDGFLTEEKRAEQKARLLRHDIAFDEFSFAGGHRLDDDTLVRVVDF